MSEARATAWSARAAWAWRSSPRRASPAGARRFPPDVKAIVQTQGFAELGEGDCVFLI